MSPPRHTHPIEQQRWRPTRTQPTPVRSNPANAFEQIVGVAGDGGVLHPAGHFAALHAIGQSNRMTERTADHVPLPHADQIIDDQSVLHILNEPAAQCSDMRTMPAIADSEQNVRIPDVRFAKYPAPAVSGALSFRARGGFESVHEPSHSAAFYEPGGAGANAFVVAAPRCRAARSGGIVDDRESLIDHHRAT